MAIIGDALRQAFMPKREYQNLRDEEKAWIKLQKPIFIVVFTFIILLILISNSITLTIMFPSDPESRPFCKHVSIQNTTVNEDQEIVDYYWLVMFVPSVILFFLSGIYLVAGMIVAYNAPSRHGCLKVVENSYCAPNRGGVRCLFILNFIYAIIFGLLATFVGSTLLAHKSSCSIPLFFCYEIQTWALVTLYGLTASLLRRKGSLILDNGELGSQILRVEMLEVNPVEFTPDMERRINEGFKSWMGSSYIESDDEDDIDGYLEAPHLFRTNHIMLGPFFWCLITGLVLSFNVHGPDP